MGIECARKIFRIWLAIKSLDDSKRREYLSIFMYSGFSIRLLYKETQDSMLFRALSAQSAQNVKIWKNVKNCAGDYVWRGKVAGRRKDGGWREKWGMGKVEGRRTGWIVKEEKGSKKDGGEKM